MYRIVYLNWRSSKEEFKECKNTIKEIVKNFDDLNLEDILIPSSKWNYAALKKI